MRIDQLPAKAADPSAPSPAYQQCVRIRREVFVVGQAVPLEIEFDGLDPISDHFLASRVHAGSHTPVGTARMRIVNGVGKAERIAVLEQARGSGVGQALMRAIERHAHEMGLRCMQLNAQLQAAGFYEKLGYRAEGPVFVEAGIDHRAMTKLLD